MPSTSGIFGGAEQYNLNGFPGHPLTSILSYDYHSAVNAADAMVLPDKKEDTKLEVEKKKGQYYLIILATTLNGKLKNRYYRYSDDYNNCVEVKAGKKR